jgi:glycosyltransferase involved in cell wall biosynthesis
MKIALDISILFHDSFSGVHRLTHEAILALNLLAHEHEIVLVGVKPRAKQFAKMIPELAHMHTKLLSLPQRFVKSTVYYPKQLLPWNQADVYHSFDGHIYAGCRITTATLCDLTPLTHPDWHTKENVKAFQTRFKQLDNIDWVFTISQAVSTEFELMRPEHKNRTSIMPIGSDHLVRIRKKTSHRFERFKPYILALGNMEPRKNWLRLQLAYKQLPEALRSKYQLVVASRNGWGESRIVDEAGVHQLFDVSDNELYELYRHAAVFVFPSLYEGFGLPVLEAMRAGTIVVTTRNGGLREVGDDLVLRVEARNVDEISAAIVKVLTLPKHRYLGLKKASQKYAQDLKWKQAAVHMIGVWEKLYSYNS